MISVEACEPELPPPDTISGRNSASSVTLWSLSSKNPSGIVDRKSTRLNSSHSQISYAVFCLKKTINDTLATTGLELNCYRILTHYAVLRGMLARSRSIVGNIPAAFQLLSRGTSTLYTNLSDT